MNKTKLAMSNIAWYPGQIDDFIDLIVSIGCKGIELATNMIWDEPLNASMVQRRELRKKVEDAGLKVTGLQSLLFTHRELTIFGNESSRMKMLDYLTHLMDLCRDLGGNVLVFGSPGNRNIKNNMPYSQAYEVAVNFFRKIGELAAERGVCFCIEPLGKVETNFINSVAEGEKLIKDCGNSVGLGLHIDCKGLIDESEYNAPYLEESFSRAKHVHVRDSGLKPPGTTGFDHSLISKRINKSGYSRFLSVEMRRVDEDVEGAIGRALEYVKHVYFRGVL